MDPSSFSTWAFTQGALGVYAAGVTWVAWKLWTRADEAQKAAQEAITEERKAAAEDLAKCEAGRLQDYKETLQAAVSVMQDQSRTNTATAAAIESRNRVTDGLDRSVAMLAGKIERVEDAIERIGRRE